jgi:hypothetical protein
MAAITLQISLEQNVAQAFKNGTSRQLQDIQQQGQYMVSNVLGFFSLSSAAVQNRSLYEQDIYNWAQTTAALIRAAKWYDLDPESLAEEVESVAGNTYSKVSSAIYQVLVHLLKWRYQPQRRSRSWQRSLVEHRNRIPRELRHAHTLERKIPEMIREEYPAACRKASVETGLPLTTFPTVCPWSPEQIRDHDFWPDAPQTSPSADPR